MADPGDKKRRATYQDVLDAPRHVVAELVDGELHVSPRPGGPHARVEIRLGALLHHPFDLGIGGPGGWIILAEPELHVGDDVVVPDLAGWRRERMPTITQDAYFSIAPDWVCEIVSRRTEAFDRGKKLAIYAAAGVGHVWLVSAIRRTLEVLRRHDGKWLTLAVHMGDATVRAEPFEAIELDLALLWADLAPPPIPPGSRASESSAGLDYEYDI